MPAVPGFRSYSLEFPPFLVDGQLTVQGEDVLLAQGQTSAITPNHRIPQGSVVVKRTATGKYLLADNALGDRNTAPSITSSGHVDTLAALVIVGNHGTISVTTSTGAGSESENATDLNANTAFAAHYIASSAGGELTITARAGGAEEFFYIDATSDDGFGFSEGDANKVQGADADYRVTAFNADLKDLEGADVDALAPALTRGKFRESELSNLTGEAKAVFLRRGSEFI